MAYILQWNKFDNWDSGAGIGQQIGKVCRCQKNYRKSYIEEGQAMQWPSEKGQNDKQWSTKTTKTTQKIEDWAARIPLKTRRNSVGVGQFESLVLHCMAVPGFVPWSASLIVQHIWVLLKYVENNLK